MMKLTNGTPCFIRIAVFSILLLFGLSENAMAQYQDFKGYDINRLNQGADFLKTVYSLSSDRMSSVPDGVKLSLDALKGPFDHTFRAEVREEDINTYPEPKTSQVYRMQFQLDQLPDLHGPMIIFQRFNRDLDEPDIALELTGAKQFRDATPNEIQVVAFGSRIRVGKFLKPKNDLMVIIYNDANGAGKYKVSLNGETLIERTGIRTLASTNGSWTQFGLYFHGMKDATNRSNQVNSGYSKVSFTYYNYEKQYINSEVSLDDYSTMDLNQTGPTICGDPPQAWNHTDVGSVQISGESCFDQNDQEYSVYASGEDIWGTSDQFHYLYQTLPEDGEIIAQLSALANSHEFAKAGLMIREGLNPDARHVSLFLNQTQRSFQFRSQTGGITQSLLGWESIGNTQDLFLRLVKVNEVLAGFTSSDGRSWDFMNAHELLTSQPILVGMAMTSHVNTTLGSAHFNGVVLEKRQSEGTASTQPQLQITSQETVRGPRLIWEAPIRSDQGFFEVERSLDNMIYERSGRVFVGERTDSGQRFQWVDQDPGSSQMYYRLRLQNYDGSFGYVGDIIVHRDGFDNRSLSIYPNPIQSRSFSLEVRGVAAEEVGEAYIQDLAGRTHLKLDAGLLYHEVNIPESVPPGLYFIRVETTQGQLGARLFLE